MPGSVERLKPLTVKQEVLKRAFEAMEEGRPLSKEQEALISRTGLSLSENQKDSLKRALDKKKLPFFGKAKEITGRAEALSLKRELLVAELEAIKTLDAYQKAVVKKLGEAKTEADQLTWRAELSTIQAVLPSPAAEREKRENELQTVTRALDEYGEKEIRPYTWRQIFGRGWSAGSVAGVAGEVSLTAVVIALGLPITLPALAAAALIGIGVGGTVGGKTASKLNEGAERAQKEIHAFGKISKSQEIIEIPAKMVKAAWCLDNGIPITEHNLGRDKKDLLERVKDDRKEKREFHHITNKKVSVLWEPKEGTCAYFNSRGDVLVAQMWINRNKEKNIAENKGFIVYYGDGNTGVAQFRNKQWPKGLAELETKRSKFEDMMNARLVKLKERKDELDGKIAKGEIPLQS